MKHILFSILFFLSTLTGIAQVYQLGDVITNSDGSKGIVFWVKPDGSGGWMSALTNASSGCIFGVGQSPISNSNSYYALIDFDGYGNTKTIRTAQNNDPTTAVGVVDFKNGWYLPSMGQLELLFCSDFIIKAAGGTVLPSGFYWSSNTTPTTKVWTLIKGAGAGVAIKADVSASESHSVRAIRDFTNGPVVSYDTTLTYLWNTGSTLPYINVTPTANTTYSVTATSSVGCSTMAEKTIIVDNSTAQVINDTICQGNTYIQYGFRESTTGTFLHSYSSTDGCTVPITLNLVVNPSYKDTIRDTICQQTTYNKHGFNITPTSAGQFTETLNTLTTKGCDSLFTLLLTVRPSYSVTIKDTIMQGDIYKKNGFDLPAQSFYGNQTYQLSKTTVLGCDSTINLNLTILPKIDLSKNTLLSDTVCQNHSYTENGFNLPIRNQSGVFTYALALKASSGVDSTVVLNLHVLTPKSNAVSHTICLGRSYSFGGKPLTVAGIYKDTLAAASGCDSVVTLTLSVKQKIQQLLNRQICKGSYYNFEGINLSKSGIYTHLFPLASGGCDSLLVLHLTVLKPDTTYLNITINEGESYSFGGQKISTVGIYHNNLSNRFNCDSLVILNLKDTNETITIPEVFTPNKDGVSDYFEIKNIDKYPNNSILIFNRWGNKVFEGKPYQNNWDGTNQFGVRIGGDQLPVGTYFYVFNLGDGSPIKKGYIYLNR